MQDWFVKPFAGQIDKNDLVIRLADTSTKNIIEDKITAQDYLKWSDQFKPDFDLIREALKRPYVRMDGDYTQPFQIPIPNYITVRSVAQTLDQRAKCFLLLGQPEKALGEATLLNDMRHLFEAEKPMTLVSAMLNVAVVGSYVETIADGMRLHAWQELQLVTLQNQLETINMIPFTFDALRQEPAAVCGEFGTFPIKKIIPEVKSIKLSIRLAPRGWIYENMINVAELDQKALSGFDLKRDTISPHQFNEASLEIDRFFYHSKSPFKILAAVSIPNFVEAEKRTAYNQTLVNEGQIACALERYKLANGYYPETLDALAPQFIEKIPHDIIGGQPLHYRRTDDGKFLLYSVGWNETDDGGQEVSPQTKNGGMDYTKGDWVWQYPPK
jgi:hypothetical protein